MRLNTLKTHMLILSLSKDEAQIFYFFNKPEKVFILKGELRGCTPRTRLILHFQPQSHS